MIISQLTFKVNDDLADDARDTLNMFLHDWLSQNCGDDFQLNRLISKHRSVLLTFQFKNSEDALAIKLRGVPKDLSKYVELYH